MIDAIHFRNEAGDVVARVEFAAHKYPRFGTIVTGTCDLCGEVIFDDEPMMGAVAGACSTLYDHLTEDHNEKPATR